MTIWHAKLWIKRCTFWNKKEMNSALLEEHQKVTFTQKWMRFCSILSSRLFCILTSKVQIFEFTVQKKNFPCKSSFEFQKVKVLENLRETSSFKIQTSSNLIQQLYSIWSSILLEFVINHRFFMWNFGVTKISNPNESRIRIFQSEHNPGTEHTQNFLYTISFKRKK